MSKGYVIYPTYQGVSTLAEAIKIAREASASDPSVYSVESVRAQRIIRRLRGGVKQEAARS